jgi:hypothetical protein
MYQSVSWHSCLVCGHLQDQLDLQVGGWSDPSFWLEDILLTQDLIHIKKKLERHSLTFLERAVRTY